MALKDNLIANETIVFETKKHWFSPLRDSLIPILLLLGAYAVGWLSPDSQSGITGALGNLLDLIRNILLIVAVVWIIYNVLVWRSAEFAVTNFRVIREEGFISKRQSATLLANVSDVKTQRPGPGWSAPLRRHHDLYAVGFGRGRPVHDHHRTDRIPRQDHGQEVGRCGSVGRCTGPSAGRRAGSASRNTSRRHGRPGPRGDARAARGPARQRRHHARGVRGEEGRDPRADVAGRR